MKTKLQKFISMMVSIIYIGGLFVPYQTYAEDKDKREARQARVEMLIQAHLFAIDHPMNSDKVETLVASSKELLEQNPFSSAISAKEDQDLRKLLKLTTALEAALKTSQKLSSADCSGQSAIGNVARSVVSGGESSSCPSPQSKTISPKTTATTVEQLGGDVSEILLRSFVRDIALETMEEMTKNYWRYKAMYQEPISNNFKTALADVTGAFPDHLLETSFFDNTLLYYRDLRDKQTTFNIQANREEKTKELGASIERIKNRKFLGTHYFQVIEKEDPHELDKDLKTSIASLNQLTQVERMRTETRGLDHIPALEWDAIVERNKSNSRAIAQEVWKDNRKLQSSFRSSGDVESYLTQSRLDSIPVPRELRERALPFFERLSNKYAAPNHFEEFTKALPRLIADSRTITPEDLFTTQGLTSQHKLGFTPMSFGEPQKPQIQMTSMIPSYLSNGTRLTEKKGVSFEDNWGLYLDEFDQNPLTFTAHFRNLISHIKTSDSQTPHITGEDLDKALENQQTQIKEQIKELIRMTQSKDPKEDLKNLLLEDPARVWKFLHEYPQMIDYVCQAYQKLKEEKVSQKRWDRIRFWGGLGALAIAFTAATLTGQFETYPVLSYVAFGAATAGTALSLSGAIAAHTQYRAADKNFQMRYARMVAELGGDPELALQVLQERNDLDFDRVFQSLMVAGDIATFGIPRTIAVPLIKKATRTAVREGSTSNHAARNSAMEIIEKRNTKIARELVDDAQPLKPRLVFAEDDLSSNTDELLKPIRPIRTHQGDEMDAWERAGMIEELGREVDKLLPRQHSLFRIKGSKLGEGDNLVVSEYVLNGKVNPKRVVKEYKPMSFSHFDQYKKIRKMLEKEGFADELPRLYGKFKNGKGEVIGYVEERLIPLDLYLKRNPTAVFSGDNNRIRLLWEAAYKRGILLETLNKNIGVRIKPNGEKQLVLFDLDDLSQIEEGLARQALKNKGKKPRRPPQVIEEIRD